LAAVTSPIYEGSWVWETAAGLVPIGDPEYGGTNLYCPVHDDYGLILETRKPSSPGTNPDERAFCWEAAGHVTIKDPWTEYVDQWTPGGKHYYTYDFIPFDLTLSGIDFFKVEKGKEVSKVEGGSRVAMFNAVAIILGTIFWAKETKANYGMGSEATALLNAINPGGKE